MSQAGVSGTGVQLPSGSGARRGTLASSPSKLGDRIFHWLCQAAAWFIIILAGLLVLVLFWKAWLALRTIGWRFLTDTTWDPEPDHRVFGALAFVYGTLATSGIAMLIAVPLGVGTAAYLSEIAPGWLRRTASFLVEMLAAVPSVVYGFWGLFVLAPLLQGFYSWIGGPNQGGVGIFAAGFILSVMIVPYVTAVSYDACQAVPQSQRAAALSLSATRWQMIWWVVLPYARPGIVGGCFLALGRALGETMAVTMLIGNKAEIDFSLYALGDSIASSIANQFTEAAYDLYLSALVELGLVLFLLTIVVNSAARFLIWRIGRTGSSGRGLRRRLSRKPVPPREDGAQNTEISLRDGPAAPVYERLRLHNRRAQWVNHVMTGVLGSCLIVTVVPLFLILAYLATRGLSSLNWDFFTKLPVPAGEPGGGMANAIVGSAMLIGLATSFAVPIGILTAIYLAEYRSDRIGPAVRFIGELLGGVPSIVIGIFAYSLVVVPMGDFSGYAGGFALGVMMIPIVMRASEESLKMVPGSLRYASYALGASHWQTVVRVTVPAALPAIITGVFLAIARVAGETAPLLLTAAGNRYWPTSPGDWTPSLPVYIFNYAISPYADWHRQAWAAALVLMVGVMVLNFGIRFLTGRRVMLASRAE
jgi:phosphate transport system permease protein